MNVPTSAGSVGSEVLTKRPWKWRSSLWVRCLVIFALMWVITGIYLWSCCRTTWAVFRVNGVAEPPQDSPLQMLRRSSGLMSYASEYFLQDRDVVSVWLFRTGVDDRWLVRLRRFPKLTHATFDGGQVGQGLENLAGLPDFKQLNVIGSQMTVTRGWIDHIDSTISGRHFLLISQLERLGLSGFKGTISDLDQLNQHPHLRELYLGHITQLSQVLTQIEKCQNITALSIRSTELDEDAIQSICKMRHLRTLTINGFAKIDTIDSRLKEALESTSIVWGP